MRCVLTDGKPSVIGLVFRLTILTSWPALLGVPFSLRASRHEGSADMFQICRALRRSRLKSFLGKAIRRDLFSSIGIVKTSPARIAIADKRRN